MVLRMSGGLLRLALLRSGVARAVRNAVMPALLGVPAIGRQVRLRQSGIGIRYSRPRGAHPLVGTRASDVTGADGTRLYEALRGGRFVLAAPPGFAEVGSGVGTFAVAGPAMLVRPDGYVGWAGSTPAGLPAAVAWWAAPVLSRATSSAPGA
jgi:hypothetical protein